MKTVIVLMMMLFFSTLAYCQLSTGMQKEEAIQRARESAESSNLPMDSSHMQNPYAIYLQNENSWIVYFVHKGTTVSEDSDYMVRVEATSGKTPELLKGSQRQTYKSYFKSSANN